MKIYKLSDENLLEGDSCQEAKSELRITDIKQAVKNENRVNVFVNGKYSFSLDVAQVVDFKIKVGNLITVEQLAEFKKASEFGKAYQRALEWVLMRPRSKRELEDYLRQREKKNEAMERKKEWEKNREIADLIAKGEDLNAEKMRKRIERKKKDAATREKYDFNDLIIKRLAERGYVDDCKFAEYYVENRFVKKGISKKRLKMELLKKGVAEDIIDRVLDKRSDDEEILKIIAKKRAKYNDEKLINYLVRQGFSYQQVQSLVREMD